jgi:large subunit ribosomal protein L10
MAITRDRKKEVLDNLKSIVKNSPTVVFVNFHGTNVVESSEMRRALRKEGVEYVVTKKTLAKLALADQNLGGEVPTLEGEVAFAYSQDQIAPAREIYQFQKKLDGRISIVGGIFEGSFKDKEGMTVIASIPSQHVLYGQFVNLINSPIQGLVIALDAIAGKKS